LEFSRRVAVQLSGVDMFIVSREDLILSKLVWAADSKSEMQRRDIISLLHPARRSGAGIVKDTSSAFSIRVAERHAQMSADERLQIASDMFDTARRIIESSLPDTLSRRERRLAVMRRVYNQELPDAALNAHADWCGEE
jgi:hypothetical protein